MARMGTIAGRAEELLGVSVVSTTPVAGGDICTATRLRLSDGRSAFVKTSPHAPDRFFEVEAAASGGSPQPVAPRSRTCSRVSDDCLILSWIEPGRPSVDGVEDFARRLGRTHAAGAAPFGGERDGYVGTVPLTNTPTDTWAEFWPTRRVLPYLRVARDRGDVGEDDATMIETVMDRIADIAGPPEQPSRIHGDLWSGNVVWSSDGHGYLVDPAAHGGHRETDLAMLALFGAPHLSRLVDAYDEATPLGDGWRERVAAPPAAPAAGPRDRVRRVLRCACRRRGTFAARRFGRVVGRVRPVVTSQPGLSRSWQAGAMRILVVDDDRAVRDSLRRSLEFNGYEVALANDGVEALARINGLAPDALIVDVMMPRLDGIETTKALRAAGNDLPILVLTARDSVNDRVDGLDAGADDYLAKPFALDELLARVRAMLRRRTLGTEDGDDEGPLTFADLTMNTVTREVDRAGRPITFTRTEWDLLELFMRRPKRVLERAFILEEVWGYDFPTTANSLEVYVGYVRRKTEADGESRLLHTVRGVGYVLRETPP